MNLLRLLQTQGFGTRRACESMVLAGRVSVGGKTMLEPGTAFGDALPASVTVDDVAWPVLSHATIMMHKPHGYECSAQPSHHPSVLSLLPLPLRQRGVQPIGRLDVDTTGLLLLTDDGALAHRLSSPKHHVDKTYRVTLKHTVDQDWLRPLIAGVHLRGDAHVAAAKAATLSNDGRVLQLTIDEGRYHQVKRMVAAAGNRVEQLHRVAFGPWALPDDLKPGQWCWADT